MAKKSLPRTRPAPEDTAKERLKSALKENLSKRKEQARARAETDAQEEDGTPGRDGPEKTEG